MFSVFLKPYLFEWCFRFTSETAQHSSNPPTTCFGNIRRHVLWPRPAIYICKWCFYVFPGPWGVTLNTPVLTSNTWDALWKHLAPNRKMFRYKTIGATCQIVNLNRLKIAPHGLCRPRQAKGRQEGQCRTVNSTSFIFQQLNKEAQQNILNPIPNQNHILCLRLFSRALPFAGFSV